MKTKLLPVLLATTFLSTPTFAADVTVSDWQALNDEMRNNNNAVLKSNLTQWQWGRIGLDIYKSYAGIDGKGFTLTGNKNDISLFLEWQDDLGYEGKGNTTLEIKNVTLDGFTNSTEKEGLVSGGAVNVHSNSNNNNLNINNVKFINNTAKHDDSNITVAGGGLRNKIHYQQNLTIADSLFENNSAKNTNNNTKGLGGGLYLEFSPYIDGNASATYKITNTTFKTNSADYGGAVNITNETEDGYNPTINPVNFTNVTFENNTATHNGGAIYSTENINIYADGEGKTSTFSGNTANGKQEAIYMAATKTLNLIANNKGSIVFNDAISGVEDGYTVNLTGDGTGSISLFNDVSNANVKAEKTNVILNNGTTKDYTFNTLTSNASANWSIDFDITNKSADKIITNNTSSGTITLSNLNIINGSIDDLKTTDQTTNPFKVQILSTQSDALQLALSDDVKTQLGDEFILSKTEGSETSETIVATTKWDKEYKKTIVTDDIIYGKLDLTTTTTTNDSIGVVETNHEESTTTTESMGDTLVLVAGADIGDRSFETSDASSSYKLSADIDNVAAGKLDISGATSKNQKSTIDMNEKQGFTLANDTDLTFSDVSISNAKDNTLVTVSNKDATVNIDNANITGNISGSEEYAMSITGTTNIDGNISKANATATNATLTFGTETFAESKLTTNGGNMLLSNNQTEDYEIGTLNANSNTNWDIDVDLKNTKADTITSSNSEGVVYINKINNISTSDEETTIQILKNNESNNNLQLALNSNNIKVVEDVKNIGNEVYHSKNYTQEAGISLATTDTKNDSIRINKEGIYDALVLINNKETTEDRSYIFDTAGTHTLNEDLLPTTEGTLNIVGYNNNSTNSVIDAKNHSLFNLENETTLNIEGVTLSNASGDAITVSNNAELNLTNVSFSNNGGNAITSSGNVNISAKDTDVAMSENISMNGDDSNKINLSFNAEDGALNLSNTISGSNYNMNVLGGNVNVSGSISGVNNLEMSPSAILGLATTGTINATNMMLSQDTSSLARSSNPTLQIDVNIANNQITNGLINVSGDVSGTYGVIVNALSEEYSDSSSAFLKALNDDTSTSSEFSVLRVMGNPYMWKTLLNANGETTGSTWYLAMETNNSTDDDTNTDGGNNGGNDGDNSGNTDGGNSGGNDGGSTPVPNPVLAPEAVAGIGLQTAGIEQTRSVVQNVANKVAVSRSYCPDCGIVTDAWDGKQLRNSWVLVQGENANIDNPVDMDAKIWGLEGGFELQNDMNNTLGLFVSFRNGEYDLSGNAQRYRSNIGSEIEIDSYLAGLYYRYEKNMNWAFATVYGGIQEADAKSDDGIANFETDGIEFGASAEIGHSYALNRSTTLSPSLGLYYTQLNYDDAKDNVGKEYNYDDIKHLEAELGLSLTKNLENGKVYVKPSVIQSFTSGDEVSITGLNEVDTYHDQTLGRVEFGGNYEFNDSLSVHGWINYTYGSSYDATALGFGLNYSWE